MPWYIFSHPVVRKQIILNLMLPQKGYQLANLEVEIKTKLGPEYWGVLNPATKYISKFYECNCHLPFLNWIILGLDDTCG